MKFLKFKKVLCTAVSLALLVAVLPATIASAALNAQEVVVLYENYFDGESADVTECRETGITSLSADPADPENVDKKVLKMTSKGTAPSSSEDLSSFNINIKSTGQKYSARGYDSTKPVIYEVDLYIPENTIKADGVSYTGYDGLYVSPIYSSNNSDYYKNKVLAHTALKMGINASNRTGVIADGRFAISENRYDQNPTYAVTDKWHTFRWIISAGGTSVSMWVDDTLIKTASTRYQLTGARYMDGIKISSTATNNEKTQFPEGKSIYVDNVKIYQVKEAFSGQFVYDKDAAIGTLTLNHATTESELEKIAVTDSTGNAVVPAKSLSQDGRVVTLDFTGNALKSEETYTVNAAIVMDEYGLNLDEGIFSFISAIVLDMSVNADIVDGVLVPAKEFSTQFTFSDVVTPEEVKKYTTVVDEDGNDVAFTFDKINDCTLKLNITELLEYTGYTITISEELESENGLPLKDTFVIGFRTEPYEEPEEEDPYIPEDDTSSTEIFSPEALDGEWSVSVEGSTAQKIEDYISFSAAKKTEYHPQNKSLVIEQAKGKYPENSTITFNFDMRVPEKSKVSKSFVKFIFYPTDESKTLTGDKETGTYGATLSIGYEKEEGVTISKDNVTKKVVLIPENKIDTSWISIKGCLDMVTGIVTVIGPDGTENYFDMKLLPNWTTNKPYGWAKIMYLKSAFAVVEPLASNSLKFDIRNLKIERLPNTLSITDCSFEHNENYVDHNNIEIEFNEEVDEEKLKEAITVIDDQGVIVNDAVKTVEKTAESKYSIALQNINVYEKYTLKISGLLSTKFRGMNMDFVRSFVTCKGSEVYVDTLDSAAGLDTNGIRLNKAKNISYNVVLKNDGANNMPVKVGVGLYTADGEMLDVDFADVTVNAGGRAEKNFNFASETPFCAEDIRIFAWDSTGTNLKLLHKPDSLNNLIDTDTEFESNKNLPQYSAGVYDVTNSIIRICGKTNDESGLYTILVLKGEETPVSFEKEKVVYVGSANVENNAFAESFKFTKDSDSYSVYVLTGNNSYYEKLKYIKIDDLVNNFIKKVANGEIEKTDIYEETVKYNGGLGIDFENNFISTRDKDLFEKRIYERRNLLLGPTNSDYAVQFANSVSFVLGEIKYLNELSVISHYSLILRKLETGLEYSNINFSGYNALKYDSQKSAALSALVGVTFIDGDDLKNQFDASVKKAGKTTEPSGGSTGGGSGSPVGITPKPTEPTVPVEPINPNESISKKFTDLSGYNWAIDSIEYLSKRGIVSGVSENKFAPSDNVTREQIAKMLVTSANVLNEDLVNNFADCVTEAWYTNYVNSAKSAGIVNGISENEFGVGLNITRQDLAVMVYNTLKAKGYTFKMEKKTDFSDVDNISNYAKEAVVALANEGIINGMGDNTFAPLKNATRVETAVLIAAIDKLIQ